MIESKHFPSANERGLVDGALVSFKRSGARATGVLLSVWYGCEEMARVRLPDGSELSFDIEMDDVRLVAHGEDGKPIV